jgi:DNA-binding HxlR family transcriptional regulator
MVHEDPTAQATLMTNEAKAIPVASMVESIVGCKWSVGLLRLLGDGFSRPSALLRASAGLSTKVMNERLRKMLRFGIVRRTVYGEKPPVEVEYVLTPFGRRFMGIIDEVRRLQEAVDSGRIPKSAAAGKPVPARGRPTKRQS